MSFRSFKCLILVAVLCLGLSTMCHALKTSRLYTLTIYVDEGHGSLNGHVFISLSDGRKSYVYGFYAKNKLLAPIAAGGGEIRNDFKLTLYGWDVKKTYIVSAYEYDKAFDAIDAWRNNDESWWIDHHCGDFAETVAEAAGIKLDLPYLMGHNRPGVFGKYLRENGGQVRRENELQLPEVSPPVAPSNASSNDLNGKWAAVGYINNDEVVIIRHYGNVISAVKTRGNKYVPAGAVTWQGVYTSDKFPGRGQVGETDENDKIIKRYFVDINIHVTDNNSITVTGSNWTTTYYCRIRED